jgi:anthranilate synthase component 2
LHKKAVSLLIIDNYDSFTYNLVQQVEQCGVENYRLVKNDQLETLAPLSFDKVLISPGPGIASEAGTLLPFLSKYHKTKSFLGICLGFEALLELLGARLSPLAAPMHGIQNEGNILQEDPLFRRLPNRFKIGHYHSWYVKETDFPPETCILVKDSNGLPMAFRHRRYPLYGLQFHPESYMTENGQQIIQNWLEM